MKKESRIDMKKFVCFLCLLGCLALTVQAGNYRRREVTHPRFVTANTSKIEIKKIILTDEHTQVDAVLYGKPGEAAILSSDTYLCNENQKFPLREAAGVSIDGQTVPERIPDSGKQNVILSFAPIPQGVHTVDFVEKGTGRTIYGVQLTEAEPYVYLPSFLQTRRLEQSRALPQPQLKAGKAIINGYILGYQPSMQLDVVFRHSDWLFYDQWGQTVRVRQDGSFHIETDLLVAGGAKLQINKAQLDLFLTPGEETTVYIHLPRLSMSASRLLTATYGQQQKAWFDGDASDLNAELATWGYPLAINEVPGFNDMTEDLPADDFNKYVKHHYEKYKKELEDDKKVSEAYRQYVLLNLKMNELVTLGAKGEMPGNVQSPYIRYGYDYATYLALMERDKGQAVDLWEDVKKARTIYRNFIKEQTFTSDDKKELKTITQPEIQKYIKDKTDALKAKATLAKSNNSFVIAEIGTDVSGADILPAIIAPYRGQAILVDFWATWCGPCRKSMSAIRDLKKKLAAKDIVYVYLTGPSSPETDWKTAVTDINGVHYRLKKEQWDYLCHTYGITGIPGYLIISYDGKLQDKYVGFPGTDVLMKDLLRAGE